MWSSSPLVKRLDCGVLKKKDRLEKTIIKTTRTRAANSRSRCVHVMVLVRLMFISH